MTNKKRIESDSLGIKKIEKYKYWGAQTQRSLENFKIGREKIPTELIVALGQQKKAAAVAESAGLNICIHGLHETGITTCASNQVAATIPNLDDGNQFMNQLIESDIISSQNTFTNPIPIIMIIK